MTARPSILNKNPNASAAPAASNCRVAIECPVSLSTISITFPASLVTLIVNSGVISSRAGGLLSKFAAILRAPPPLTITISSSGGKFVIVKFSEARLEFGVLAESSTSNTWPFVVSSSSSSPLTYANISAVFKPIASAWLLFSNSKDVLSPVIVICR